MPYYVLPFFIDGSLVEEKYKRENWKIGNKKMRIIVN